MSYQNLLTPSGSRAGETARRPVQHQGRPITIDEVDSSDQEFVEQSFHEDNVDEEYTGYYADCFIAENTYSASSLNPMAPADTKIPPAFNGESS